MTDEVFEQYGPCRWVCRGNDVSFPILSIKEQGGNRIVEHKRPFREGAKLDDTGAEPFVWTITGVFENSLQESGLRQDEPLYPDTLNRLIRSLSVHETGNLYLPTRGAVRARPKNWDRSESNELRDYATLVITFVEDNEDAVDRAALKEPSASGSLKRLAEKAKFSAAKAGTFSLGDLQAAAEDLQNLMQAPGRAIDDVTRAIEKVKNICKRTLRVMSQETQRISQFVSAPEESDLARQLSELMDVAAGAELQRNSGTTRAGLTRTYVVPADTDLYTIAAALGVDPTLLADLNFLPDPLWINAGTKLRVPIDARLPGAAA